MDEETSPATRYLAKELSLGETLGAAFNLCVDRFRFLMALAGFVVVPGFILACIHLKISPDTYLGPNSPIPQSQLRAFSSPQMAVLSIAEVFVMPMLIVSLCSGAAAWGLTHHCIGRERSVSECLHIAGSRFGRLILLVVLQGIAMCLGLLLCIVPGFYMCAALFVATPALMFENLRAYDAMGRSLEILNGHKWKALFAFLIIVLPQTIVAHLVQALIPGPYSSLFLVDIVAGVGWVLLAAVQTVIYFSARSTFDGATMESLREEIA